MSIGVVLLLVGIVWLLQTFGVVDSSIWHLLLPLILMYFGFVVIGHHEKAECLLGKTKSVKKKTTKKK